MSTRADCGGAGAGASAPASASVSERTAAFDLTERQMLEYDDLLRWMAAEDWYQGGMKRGTWDDDPRGLRGLLDRRSARVCGTLADFKRLDLAADKYVWRDQVLEDRSRRLVVRALQRMVWRSMESLR